MPATPSPDAPKRGSMAISASPPINVRGSDHHVVLSPVPHTTLVAGAAHLHQPAAVFEASARLIAHSAVSP